MNCERARELLGSLEDRKPCRDELSAVRAHVASCSRCASGLSASDWVELLPALDEEVEPSGEFSARFHARLSALQANSADGRRSTSWLNANAGWRWPRQLAVAGALAALIVVGLLLGRHSAKAPEDAAAFADLEVAEQLPLLEDMAFISILELLEDLDTIENLSAAKN